MLGPAWPLARLRWRRAGPGQCDRKPAAACFGARAALRRTWWRRLRWHLYLSRGGGLRGFSCPLRRWRCVRTASSSPRPAKIATRQRAAETAAADCDRWPFTGRPPNTGHSTRTPALGHFTPQQHRLSEYIRDSRDGATRVARSENSRE